MTLFNQKPLFETGPHQIHVGGLALRHVLHEPPGGRGVQITSQGQSGRTLTQTGHLIADDPATLATLVNAIEQELDGHPRDLVDSHGHTWVGVVMLSFEPSDQERVGTRWHCSYQINYLQLKP